MDKEFPMWENVVSEIDSMFIEIPYKNNAIYGARVMYDILYGILNDSTGKRVKRREESTIQT